MREMENVPYLNRSYTSILLINLLYPCPCLRRAVPAPLQPPPRHRHRHQPFGLSIPPSPGGGWHPWIYACYQIKRSLFELINLVPS